MTLAAGRTDGAADAAAAAAARSAVEAATTGAMQEAALKGVAGGFIKINHANDIQINHALLLLPGGLMRTSTRPTWNLLLLLRGLSRTSTRPTLNLVLLLRVPVYVSFHTAQI
jgi:hypothetical protein